MYFILSYLHLCFSEKILRKMIFCMSSLDRQDGGGQGRGKSHTLYILDSCWWWVHALATAPLTLCTAGHTFISDILFSYKLLAAIISDSATNLHCLMSVVHFTRLYCRHWMCASCAIFIPTLYRRCWWLVARVIPWSPAWLLAVWLRWWLWCHSAVTTGSSHWRFCGSGKNMRLPTAKWMVAYKIAWKGSFLPKN